MPMYEYRCSQCEIVIEEMQKFSDAPLVDCEKCGSKGTLSKLISKSSFALKGTGWYTTDYKKSSAPPPSSGSSSGSDVKATAPDASPTAGSTTPAKSETAATPAAVPSPSKSNKAD